MPSTLSEWDYVKAWVCCIVCGMVAGAALGALAGVVLTGVQSFFSTPIPHLRIIGAASGAILGLAASYAFFRLFVSLFIVRKHSVPSAAAGGQSEALYLPKEGP